MGACSSKSKKKQTTNATENGNIGHIDHNKEEKFNLALKSKYETYRNNYELDFTMMNKATDAFAILYSPSTHDFPTKYEECELIAKKTEIADFKESVLFVETILNNILELQKPVNDIERQREPSWMEFVRDLNQTNLEKIKEVVKLIVERGNNIQIQELSFAIKVVYLVIRSNRFYDSIEKNNFFRQAESNLMEKVNDLYFFFYQDDIQGELANMYELAFEEFDARTQKDNENPVDHSGGVIDKMVLNVKTMTNKILAF